MAPQRGAEEQQAQPVRAEEHQLQRPHQLSLPDASADSTQSKCHEIRKRDSHDREGEVVPAVLGDRSRCGGPEGPAEEEDTQDVEHGGDDAQQESCPVAERGLPVTHERRPDDPGRLLDSQHPQLRRLLAGIAGVYGPIDLLEGR